MRCSSILSSWIFSELGLRPSPNTYVIGEPLEWDGSILCRVLQTKSRQALTRVHKQGLLAFLNRSLLTKCRAVEQGIQLPDTMCQCGCPLDDHYHWAERCSHRLLLREAAQQKALLSRFATYTGAQPQEADLGLHCLVSHGLLPPLYHHLGEADPDEILLVDDTLVAPAHFPPFTPEGGRIYVDGSAYHGTWRTVARSGSAAVQLRPDGTRLAALQATSGFPQNASIGEHLAVLLAARLSSGSRVTLEADCASVLSTRNLAPQHRYHHSSPMAGIRRQVLIDRMADILKVKAHRNLSTFRLTTVRRLLTPR